MKTLTATNALRAGFAAMVVLLVYSALEANSLERAGSAEELDAYHDYIALDHATSVLRRMVGVQPRPRLFLKPRHRTPGTF